jgi:hypothetical protein
MPFTMPRRHAPILTATRSARPMRWLVLLAFVFGVVVSSVGTVRSHGIAALAQALPHAVLTQANHAHGHAHEEANDDAHGASATLDPDAPVAHAHHGVDHSHDTAHVLPMAWPSIAPHPPAWAGLERALRETVRSARLERPPRA